MKKIIYLIALLFSINLNAADRAQELASTIKEVQLFLNGAQISRSAYAEISAGVTQLVFSGVSNYIDNNSIQVGFNEGELTILAVTTRENNTINPKKMPIIKLLEDSLEATKRAYLEEEDIYFVWKEQESLLLSNKVLRGEKGLVVPEIEDALELYKTKLPQIRKGLLESNERKQKLSQRIKVLEEQLRNFKSSEINASTEVIVTVNAKQAVKTNLILSYYVSNCSWSPKYDLRSSNLKSPVELVYKAELTQNTGEDWKNVKLSVSTYNPSLGGNLPVLSTEYVSLIDPAEYSNVYKKGKSYNNNMAPATEMKSEDIEQTIPENISEEGLSVQFKLERPVNILSDGKVQLLDLTRQTLNANYIYGVTPKLDRDAFLLAKIGGWERLNLLPGEASIFFNGFFVGKTVINTRTILDSLDLSMGRDKQVLVTRSKVAELCYKTTSGSKIKELNTWEINVKNNKSEPIIIKVYEQYPMSSNKDLSVEIKETSKGELDEATGIITWTLILNPGEIKSIRFGYELKYPKDRIIINN